MSDSKLQSLGSLGSKAKQIVAKVAKYFLQESKKERHQPLTYDALRRTITSSTNMKTPSLSTWQTIVAQTSPVMITTALQKGPVKENEMMFFSLFCKLFSVYYQMKQNL